MMKRYKILILIIMLLVLVPCSAKATTINDYKARISALEQEKKENENNSKKTQEKMDEVEAKINEISRKIAEARKSQKTLEDEIKDLEKQIAAKDKEIKELLAFYQISENDNFYLKFVFGAESFEDFIYRFSVAEQLTEANNTLINEMNDLIAKNEKKVKDLKNQQKKLDELNNQMEAEMKKLGNQKKKYSENALSVDEEIATLEKQIKYYRNKGCGDSDTISICSRPKSYGPSSSGASKLRPSARGFIIPMPYGTVTSYYGTRVHPIYGTISHHDGMDIAASTGTTIWASQKGEVVHADWLWGFGNAVMIYHDSCDCTTLYGHMSRISVSEGQGVSRGQKIGEVGSTGNSTGPHLHFQAMDGSGYNFNGIFDPMSLVYIPYSF